MKKFYLILFSIVVSLLQIKAQLPVNQSRAFMVFENEQTTHNSDFSEKSPDIGNLQEKSQPQLFEAPGILKSAVTWERQLSVPCAIGGGEAGIETDGNYIYVTWWSGNLFYRYSMDGTFVEQFSVAGVNSIRDLAFDGTYFYGGNGSTTVYQMDFSRGSEILVGTITAPVTVRAIAYNDDLDAFYANNWSDNITLFNRSGSVISSGACGVWNSYYGFAYDNVSEGGPYLWGFSQSTSGSVIVQMNATTYAETGFTFDVNTDLGISNDENNIAGGLFTSEKIVSGTFSIGGLVQNQRIFAYKLADDMTGCPQDIVVDNDPGECGAVVTYAAPSPVAATVTQIDNSGLTSGDEFPVGVTEQSYKIVWDGGVTPPVAVAEKSAEIETEPYAVDTCTFTVTVNDVEEPVITVSDIVVSTDDGVCGAIVNYDSPEVTDCTLPITYDYTEDFAPENWTLVTNGGNGSVDVSGAPAQIIITGSDSSATGGNIDTEYKIEIPSSGEIRFDWSYTTSDDDGAYYDPFGYSVNGAFVMLTDPNGPVVQSGSASISLRQGDIFAFVVNTTDDELGSASTTTINFSFGESVVQTAGLPSGSFFPLGETMNTFEITDEYGNTGTGSFKVTVIDEQGPEIMGPADIVVYSGSTACGAILEPSDYISKITFSEYFTQGEVSPHAQAWTNFRSQLLPTYSYTKLTLKGTYDETGKVLTDPLKILQIANALHDGTVVNIPDGTNIWTVTPAMGFVELTADGIIWDCASEYVIRADYIEGPYWGGVGTGSCEPPSQQITLEFEIESDGSVIALDNCSEAVLEQTGGLPVGSIFPVGTTTNTYIATDVYGNQSDFSYSVTVLDTISPTLKAKSIEVFLDENGEYTLTEEDIMDMVEKVSDDCDDADLEIGAYPVDFSCVHVGKEPVVQIVAKDKSGNEAKAWVTITVSDTLAPVIAAVEDVEVETELCDTAVAIDYPEIKVNDVCDVDLELIAGLGADAIFPVGITTETWVATDAAGNTDTLSFDIIVTAGNDLPTLDSIADITADEDAESVVIELSGISYGEDCAEQDLTVSAGSLDATLVDSITVNYVSGDSTGTIEIALAPNMSGTTEITVTVEDEGGAEVSQTFMLTVTPVNDAPFVVMPVPDQTVYASYVLEIPVSSVLGELFNDVDDDELEISVMVEGADSLPAWATMTGDTLVCEPMIADTGCVNIVMMATDTSGATAADTFELCVDGYPTATGDIGFENLEVTMYPNPTSGQVTIEMSSGIHNIDLAVIDITGRVVMQKQYTAMERVAFDMSGKVAGMYFLHMNIDGEQIIKKLIVDNK